MLPDHLAPRSAYIVVRRRELVRPADLAEARELAQSLAPTATRSERRAIEDDLLTGRVLVARRRGPGPCDEAEIRELPPLGEPVQS